jgi:hypothetical protein
MGCSNLGRLNDFRGANAVKGQDSRENAKAASQSVVADYSAASE